MNTQKSSEVFSRNLTALMNSRRTTNQELGTFCGVSAPAVSAWRHGSLPESDKLDRICLFFGVDSSDLFYDIEEELLRRYGVEALPRFRRLPILGIICAGGGVVMSENYLGTVVIDGSVQADYALRVKGDSMIGDGINDGDLVFIRQQAPFDGGRIYAVAFRAEEEAVVRRVFVENNKYILVPSNPRFASVVADLTDIFIIGQVVGLYRGV